MRISLGLLSILVPRIAARIADRLFFTPMGLPRPASEMPYYESASHSSIEYEGKKIAVYSWGEGKETIILVHGWASRGTRLGHLAPPLNQAGFRVISFDMPAHGDSEGKTTNLFEGSEIISLLSEKFSPVRAIVGHSFGGMALCNAIHRHHLGIGRVVIIASPFTMEYIVESFRLLMNVTTKVRDMMIAKIQKRFNESDGLDIYELSVDSFANELEMPFLIIHDKEDRDVPFSQGEGYVNSLPDAEFISTTGLGHRRILKDPGIISKIVKFVTAE